MDTAVSDGPYPPAKRQYPVSPLHLHPEEEPHHTMAVEIGKQYGMFATGLSARRPFMKTQRKEKKRKEKKRKEKKRKEKKKKTCEL
jgi:hypothetical protein